MHTIIAVGISMQGNFVFLRMPGYYNTWLVTTRSPIQLSLQTSPPGDRIIIMIVALTVIKGVSLHKSARKPCQFIVLIQNNILRM